MDNIPLAGFHIKPLTWVVCIIVSLCLWWLIINAALGLVRLVLAIGG